MNSQFRDHLFYGAYSPFSAFSGFSLLLIASTRIVYALVCAFSILWINTVTLLCTRILRRVFPGEYSSVVLLFLSSLWALVFFCLLSLLDPVLAMESQFILLFCPLFTISTAVYQRCADAETDELLGRGASEALVMGALVLALSFIREPLGFASLSLPGLPMIRLLPLEPLRILQFSSGTFILLGFAVALYRYLRNQYTGSEDD